MREEGAPAMCEEEAPAMRGRRSVLAGMAGLPLAGLMMVAMAGRGGPGRAASDVADGAAGGMAAPMPEELEARARALFRELRCMVCENQSIDESEAPVAAQMRDYIRGALRSGRDEAGIVDFLRRRYGEKILLRPRFDAHNWLLWASGPAFLVGGALFVWRYLAQRRAATDTGNTRLPDR